MCDREEFEKWLLNEQGLTAEWDEDRNCYKEFQAHLAWKAWQAAPQQRGWKAMRIPTGEEGWFRQISYQGFSEEGAQEIMQNAIVDAIGQRAGNDEPIGMVSSVSKKNERFTVAAIVADVSELPKQGDMIYARAQKGAATE